MDKIKNKAHQTRKTPEDTNRETEQVKRANKNNVAHTTPAVSVICTCYNHGNYIADALEGIIMQQTTFPFEALVCDDASTDNSAEIIQKYAQNYPHIIKAFIQKDNLYQQGIESSRFLIERAQGKYLALCEGDDFWTDPNKLQDQFDLMENTPNATFCLSNCKRIDAITGTDYGAMIPWFPEEKIVMEPGRTLTVGDIDTLYFPATSTFFFPRKTFNDLPKAPAGVFGGDRYYQLFLTAAGCAVFLNKITACYRYNVPCSSTVKRRSSRESDLAANLQYIKMYDFFNEYTKGRFYQHISKRMLNFRYQYMMKTGNKNVISRSDALRIARKKGFKCSLRTLLCIYALPLYKLINKSTSQQNKPTS